MPGRQELPRPSKRPRHGHSSLHRDERPPTQRPRAIFSGSRSNFRNTASSSGDADTSDRESEDTAAKRRRRNGQGPSNRAPLTSVSVEAAPPRPPQRPTPSSTPAHNPSSSQTPSANQNADMNHHAGQAWAGHAANAAVNPPTNIDSIDTRPIHQENDDMEQGMAVHDYTRKRQKQHPYQARKNNGYAVTVANKDPLPIDALHSLPPLSLGNPMAGVLGPAELERADLHNFIEWWVFQGSGQTLEPPARSASEVNFSHLQGDQCDLQGINWEAVGITRKTARALRPLVYDAHLGRTQLDESEPGDYVPLRMDNMFRYKQLDIRSNTTLAHYQLRSLLACPNRSQAFYTDYQGVQCFDTISKTAELFIRTPQPSDPTRVSALDADCGVLVAGTLEGSYYIQSYENETRNLITGKTSRSRVSPFTNHVRVHTGRRSSAPVAAFASNDGKVRIMDIERQKFTSMAKFKFPINRTAVSPDRQLRVVTGDVNNAYIVSEDGGDIVQQLTGHRGYLYGCDWSDDGRTVATSSQDKTIKVWDARRWCDSRGVSTPIATIACNLGAPNVRFSPTGGGRPVLVAAESADFVHIIDTEVYADKQTFDIFSEIAGVSFTNDGRDLTVFCPDRFHGGLLHLERSGREFNPALDVRNLPEDDKNDPLVEIDEQRWLTTECRRQRRTPTMFEMLPPF